MNGILQGLGRYFSVLAAVLFLAAALSQAYLSMSPAGSRLPRAWFAAEPCAAPLPLRSKLKAWSGQVQRREWTKKLEGEGAYSVQFSVSGDEIAVAGWDGKIRILNTASGEEIASHDQLLQPNLTSGGCALFSDGGKAIASRRGRSSIEVWAISSGKSLRRFEVPDAPATGSRDAFSAAPMPVLFSPDERLLAVEAGTPADGKLLLFDTASGKVTRELALGSQLGGAPIPMPVARYAFTPDGRVLATAYLSGCVSLWDVRAGEKLRQLTTDEGAVSSISISPTGRQLASCTGDWQFHVSTFEVNNHRVHLWDLQTGRDMLAIDAGPGNLMSVAFLADGRAVAAGGGDRDVRVWETSTGQQLLQWKFDGRVHQIAPSPDGRSIAVALDDGCLSLLPIDAQTSDAVRAALDKDVVAALWKDLGSSNAARAYAAVRSLSEVEIGMAADIGKQLKSVPAIPATEIARVIADLNADDFDRREAASKQLAAVGPQAEAALRKALEDTDSAEARSRIKELLKPLEQWVVTDPDMLRSLRAIWVLERIGTPEARAVLEDLAKGAPEARQTQEAKNALDFLDKRAAAAKP